MGALTPPPPSQVPEVHFLLTNDLKQSDLIIFFKSYSLEKGLTSLMHPKKCVFTFM